MFQEMSQGEVNRWNRRVLFLGTSPYMVDNITSILMDIDKGGGENEEVARVKAHAILSHIKFKEQLIIQQKDDPDNVRTDTFQTWMDESMYVGQTSRAEVTLETIHAHAEVVEDSNVGRPNKRKTVSRKYKYKR